MTRSELAQNHPNAKMHVTDGSSTIAIDNGNIVAVCKNPGDIKGNQLLQFAVKNGGNKLDSYDGNHGFYIKNGFEPVSWCKWDQRYASDGWEEAKVEAENIIFYKYTGKESEYKTPDDFYKAIPASKDYDTASEERDKNL